MFRHSQKPSEVNSPWKTTEAQVRYENDWIRVSHEKVITPTGRSGIYGRVHMKNLAIGILAMNENEEVYLVGQYRYPLDEYSWEIPEGGCPYHENPLQAAKRELKEETGLEASIWNLLCNVSTSNCITDERGIIFLATQLESGIANPDDTELLEVIKRPFEEVLQKVKDGVITDAISVTAILHYALFFRD